MLAEVESGLKAHDEVFQWQAKYGAARLNRVPACTYLEWPYAEWATVRDALGLERCLAAWDEGGVRLYLLTNDGRITGHIPLCAPCAAACGFGEDRVARHDWLGRCESKTHGVTQ